jgi:hypothetical protein
VTKRPKQFRQPLELVWRQFDYVTIVHLETNIVALGPPQRNSPLQVILEPTAVLLSREFRLEVGRPCAARLR